MKLEAFTVDNIPLIKKGDDLAALICENTGIQDNDIVVIASTIVSKSEGRTFVLDGIVPTQPALEIACKNGEDPRFIQAVLDRSRECLVESPILLVETLNGHVCIKAGIDNSNVENGLLLELPKDPDASAKQIVEGIHKITSKRVSVIITDTNGRAFKIGQTGVAIGLSNIAPIKNWCGEKDLFGRVLEITEEGVADEIAGTANLLMGEGDGGNPVVIIRGLEMYVDIDVTIKETYRPDGEDVVRKGLRCL
ncbi:MAG: coenzyme F420-0:L-glutamate ligase [Methanosarcinaceae archaeon]|nr:coenzyme F420-0:L-glutamate ligase [Methanosarcinaceae archaeon]MDF1533566.1 coenzyme F420-0:L-glutamate ligase [Methanosarcinaceae archaeon]